MNEGDAVRNQSMDEMFAHMRQQDKAIANLHGRFDTQDEKLVYIYAISQNLKGFSEFCSRSGRRLNRFMKWIATVVAPIVAVYAIFKEQIDAFFKRWFG